MFEPENKLLPVLIRLFIQKEKEKGSWWDGV